MTSWRFGLSTTLAIASLLCAQPSRAQSASGDAAAQKFFEEGRALMQEQRYDEACAKFDASDTLSPAGGTLLNLAGCYEKAGKTASAWAKYNEAADRANAAHRTDAERFARDHARALAGVLSYLRLVVATDASRTAGLEIRLDGTSLAPATWGTPLPIDPGVHHIAVSAPSKKALTLTTTISASTTGELGIPALEDATSSSLPPPPQTADEPPPVDHGSSNGSAQRVLGLGVTTVGLVGLGVGAVFGITAKTKHDRVAAACPNDQCTDPSYVQTDSDAKSAATISTVAFIAGGALAVGGIVLFLVAPKSTRSDSATFHVVPTIGPNAGHLAFVGQF